MGLFVVKPFVRARIFSGSSSELIGEGESSGLGEPEGEMKGLVV